LAPNHSTATLDMLSTNMTIGKIEAISRPTDVEVAVTSAFAREKRSVS
jgi:hypothetical protein